MQQGRFAPLITFNEQCQHLGIFVLLLGLAYILAWLPLFNALIGAAGITFALLLLRYPWLVWPAIASVLPFASSIKLEPASITDLLLVMALGLWLADGVRRRSLQLRPCIISWLMLLYTIFLSASTLGATNLGEAILEMIKWVQVILVLILVREMLPPNQTKWLVAALIVGGIGQAILGIYQFIYRIGPEWFIILGRFMRASGTFSQPNPYAGYLGLCLPVAVSMVLWVWTELGRVADRRTPASRRGLLVWAFFYSTAVVLISAALLASWSRGGWLGATVGTGIVVALRSLRSAILTSGLILLLLVAILFGSFNPDIVPAPIANRLADIPAYFGLTDVLSQPLTDQNFAVMERMSHWVAALRMWERAPWLGIGPGNFDTVYPEVHLPRWDISLGHAHNIYLNALGETGLLGLLIYILIWAAILGWVWHHFRRSQVQWNRALTIGVIGVLFHLSVHNFFDNLFVQGMYLHVGLWLAAVDLASKAEVKS